MISRLTRVSWTVGTETVSIFKRRSPSINSVPVAPPVKPIHFASSPNPWRAMATCAALPPGARWASETRLTHPTWNSSNSSRVSMAGFKLTQKKAARWPRESESGLFISGILFQPGRGMAKARIDRLDVGDAFRFQPFLKRLRSAADKNAHAVLPGGPSAKHAAKMHAGFGRELKSFVERAIAHAGGEKQKRFRQRPRSLGRKPWLQGLPLSKHRRSIETARIPSWRSLGYPACSAQIQGFAHPLQPGKERFQEKRGRPR